MRGCVYMPLVEAVKCLNLKWIDQLIAMAFGSIGTMAIMKLIAYSVKMFVLIV